jgi:hypothetical protein
VHGLADCQMAVGRSTEAVGNLEYALRIVEAKTRGAPHRWADELRRMIEDAKRG